ncbi:hypothetical protein FRACYDRAFT_268292 [Fragilariopsis cylindrus CCMP1102]|uniref:Uncharacterized protein n=1 Tax=Fragilariopsis cylindrus CCMP1102 TaxID=635003 RepID=A0A1E7FJS7_9STRA|nr:hypothetical protein FRACYDRAFT_268292 [Fragilariopsis cylindrus CCMP1102]|eukprot:OEU18408.1 hypothetical protein FRACYDRAFT_268292 [Fragilariopsis cylindrus CCMP1102]
MKLNIIVIVSVSIFFSSSVLIVDALGLLKNKSITTSSSCPQSYSKVDDVVSVSVSRRNFVTAVLAGGITASSTTAKAAWSKEISADQAKDNFISQCLYECTKPKGDEQKSRNECISECKIKYKASK